ncbi:hypothetical protein ACWGLF_43925, partial [Streptomyces puniciscabiei]
GFFFPMLSMMDIILLGPKPLICDVRQSGSSPHRRHNAIPHGALYVCGNGKFGKVWPSGQLDPVLKDRAWR